MLEIIATPQELHSPTYWRQRMLEGGYVTKYIFNKEYIPSEPIAWYDPKNKHVFTSAKFPGVKNCLVYDFLRGEILVRFVFIQVRGIHWLRSMWVCENKQAHAPRYKEGMFPQSTLLMIPDMPSELDPKSQLL